MALKFSVLLQNTARSGRSSGVSFDGTPSSSSKALVAVCSCKTPCGAVSHDHTKPYEFMWSTESEARGCFNLPDGCMEHVIGVREAQQLQHTVMLRPVRELQVASRGLTEVIDLRR